MKPKVPKDFQTMCRYYSNSSGNKFKRNLKKKLKIKENSSQNQFYAFAGFTDTSIIGITFTEQTHWITTGTFELYFRN